MNDKLPQLRGITSIVGLIAVVLLVAVAMRYFEPQKSVEQVTPQVVINQQEPCGDSSCDAAEQADANLCPQDCTDVDVVSNTNTNSNDEETNANTASDLQFVPDAGYRLAAASNPGVRFTEDGTLQLLYEDRSGQTNGPPQLIAEADASSDWLDFESSSAPVSGPDGFRALKLPDGTCRAYGFDSTKGLEGVTGMTSKSSKDCVTFTPDSGTRYELQSEDKGTMGVYELFVDSTGGIVLLYIGDMYGANNVSRAYSTDNGWTFTFTNDNVFGDENLDEPGTYVDEKVIALPDGRFRAITMRHGKVYTFISEDDGKTFTQEPGVVLDPADFTDLELRTFNDPQIIQLPDGRFRIYVTAYPSRASSTSEVPLPYIVSATTAR